MNNRTLLALVVALIFARTAFSQDDGQALQSMSLKDALAGNGSLVILKGETISGLNPDGTPTLQQNVVYYGANEAITPRKDYYLKNAGQMSCIAMIQTTDNDHNGGFAVTLKENSSIAWDTDEIAKLERFDTTADGAETIHSLHLTFFAAHSKLTVIDCGVKGQHAMESLTVKDFENAMGGRMALVPQQN
jgi:hypothetical protein